VEDCEDKQGSVYYLTWRKARLILGRELGRGEYMRAKPLLQRLGFRRAKTSDGTAFIINTRSPHAHAQVHREPGHGSVPR